MVELTIALHRVFTTPRDKFVFDVSHQGYVHKMFTGRLDRIHTMRQYEGLNGFLLRTESEHDVYGAGHAGTALSAGLGMAVGRDLLGGKENVVVVAGDAAFTCGISYEALNNVRAQTKRFIVVLNDNEWSIAKNVGAIAAYLNNIVTNPTYAHLHEKAGRFIKAIGGKSALHLAHKVEEGMKNLLLPSVIFEELGLRYYGPIDGHDIPLLTRTFEFLKKQDEPVLLHILTKKGKGYEPAIAKPDKFHGLGKFNAETGETAAAPTPTYSEILGKTLGKFADTNRKIVAITGAMPSGTGLGFFQAQHPDRYYDVGIAEEHAALFACGLATQGLKPFLTIYSTFMQRAYDMIIHDIALQNLNVALCMDRAGLSGDDGPTHHGVFDIGYLRHVPNIVHMQPKDEDEFVDMLWTMANYNSGPIAVRYPRGAGTGAKPKATPRLLEIGKAEVVQHGKDVAIFGLGNMFEMAQEAAAETGSARHLGRAHQPALDQTDRHRHARIFCAQRAGGLHDRGSCPAQRFRLRRDGASSCADDQHSGRAHRLARSVHRARDHPDPAQEARPDQRRAGRKGTATAKEAVGEGALERRAAFQPVSSTGFQPGECGQDARLTRQPE